MGSRRDMFPASFQNVVVLLYWMNHIDNSLPNRLPWEVWTKYIISMLPFDAFEAKCQEQLCAACGASQPSRQCGRCRAVHYCGRDCQRQHWPTHKANCLAANSTK